MNSITAKQVAEKPATLEHACRIIGRISHIAHANGYMLALYGSTLTYGRGRDIDVIAVPWRFGATAACLFLQIETCGFTRANAKTYEGLMQTQALQLVENDTGLVLDLQVREAVQQEWRPA